VGFHAGNGLTRQQQEGRNAPVGRGFHRTLTFRICSVRGLLFRDFRKMDVNLALSPQAILFDRIDSKPKVLAALADLLAGAYGLDRIEVLENLEAREALGSTGFGRGVAIPHCRSKDVRRPSLALIRLEQPIDFVAADSRPVALVCGLVSPENAGATHLHALAAISRLTRDEAKLQMLADAPTTEAAYALLTHQFERDAA
jgi:PTS system nitrogen regulatory IIA component